jgi:sugar/nucleoside kinase (ribokinase family)
MTKGKITISGTGCALADFLYTSVSFNSASFLKYCSKKAGDGGLSPGKLVFTEKLEQFAGKPYPEILKEITNDRQPDSFNIGGPGLVSLIHASQVLDRNEFSVRFYGGLGNDDRGDKILNLVTKTPLGISNYKVTGNRASPFTDVLSDPSYDKGHGERTFVNNIGAAWDYTEEFLNDDFFNSEIVCFGGTALVPRIHEQLSPLLARAKKKDCIKVVNTVYDFHNEQKAPGKKWPLGNHDESLGLIDVLILDSEEAARISGKSSQNDAAQYFIAMGVSSFAITNGANDILAYSNGKVFKIKGIFKLPVSQKVKADLISGAQTKGDTTGCGDNFAGGLIASLANQLKSVPKGEFDFREALSWAVVSGGFACFYKGGTYFEKKQGEKQGLLQSYCQDYLSQIKL